MSNPFVFVGENVALDFVNTEIMVRNQPRDLLASPADLHVWKSAAQVYHPELSTINFDDPVFQQAITLRGAIRRILKSVIKAESPPSSDMEILNHILAAGHLHLEATGVGQFSQRYIGKENGLLTLATVTATLLTQYDLSRLHQCKNERCILMFYDTTKSGTRRWCTPDCQNRARSIEHYQKRRGD
ncbi:MAG: ABATE domain-containing protein [Anaerolineae bacterium]|nr:ABATE domain-containing protein [Anaerolineae bacterium]